MKVNTFLPVLKSIELFAKMDDESIHDIFRDGRYVVSSFGKGSIIALDGELCNSWDIILSGTIIVQRIGVDGNIITMAEFDEGKTLGGNLVFSSNPKYPMTLIAKTNVTLLRIPGDKILDMCLLNRENLKNYLFIVSDKTHILTSKFKSIVKKPLRQCLIDYILLQHKLQKSTKITLNTSKKELAHKFGVQRTSLSRELNKMKKDGLLDFDSKYIYIKQELLMINS